MGESIVKRLLTIRVYGDQGSVEEFGICASGMPNSGSCSLWTTVAKLVKGMSEGSKKESLYVLALKRCPCAGLQAK